MHYLCVESINTGTYETETSLIQETYRNLLTETYLLIGNHLAHEAGGPAGLHPELSVTGSSRINGIASTV